MSEPIHPSAQIGQRVQIGQCTVIGENVTLGDDVQIGHHVVIHADTVIGSDVRIDDQAVLGKLPMRAKAIDIKQGENLTPLKIGSQTLIGTGAILYRGSTIGSQSLIADYASVREESTIGDITIIGRSAVVENQVKVGNRCKIETAVFIPAFSQIGNGCFIAPGVIFTNDNFMGRTEERKQHYKGPTLHDGGRIGANATILPGIVIEHDGVAAAGSVITRDIPPQKIVVGVPAHIHGDVPQNQLLKNQ